MPQTHQDSTKSVGSLIVGQRNIRFGKYNWRVLDVQDGRVLLLTEDIIEKRRYPKFIGRDNLGRFVPLYG